MASRSNPWRWLSCAGLLAACSPDAMSAPLLPETSAAGESTTLAEILGAGSSTGEGSSGSTAEGSSSSGFEDPAPPSRFDLLVPDAPAKPMGCRAIDFLFVIDNSSSMYGKQQRLIDSVPGFIAAIERSLRTVDSVHVGVITSDAYVHNEDGCQTLGDLVTQTEYDACGPFPDGRRYATDNLDTVFPCMALVGAGGDPLERPVTAAIAALGKEKAAPGACNEGFLRDDAILVIVIVTDDGPLAFGPDDANPHTDTRDWFDSIVAAKHNDRDAIVVIGFVPWGDVSCVVPSLVSPNLVGLVQAFDDHGVLASVCLPDYAPVFAETIDTIDTACTSFVPPS